MTRLPLPAPHPHVGDAILCGCQQCYDYRADVARRVFIQGVGDDDARVSDDHYLNGDLDQIGSRRRYEFGE